VSRYKYAIVYIGAPYGDNESGHITSRHCSLATAKARFAADFSGRTGAANHIIVPTHDDGTWCRSDAVIGGAA